MMPSFRSLVVLALVVPTLAQAQRRTMIRDDAPPELKAKDLQALNPARIVLDRRQALALTTDQSKQLDSIVRSYDLRAGELGKGLDTLQNILNRARRSAEQEAVDRMTRRARERPSSARDSIERARRDSIDQAKADREAERTLAARNSLGDMLLVIRDEYDACLHAMRAILTDDQRAKIGPLLESASDELTTRLRWANSR